MTRVKRSTHARKKRRATLQMAASFAAPPAVSRRSSSSAGMAGSRREPIDAGARRARSSFGAAAALTETLPVRSLGQVHISSRAAGVAESDDRAAGRKPNAAPNCLPLESNPCPLGHRGPRCASVARSEDSVIVAGLRVSCA